MFHRWSLTHGYSESQIRQYQHVLFEHDPYESRSCGKDGYMVFTCPSIPLIFKWRFIVQHTGKTWSNYYARAFRSVFWQSFIVWGNLLAPHRPIEQQFLDGICCSRSLRIWETNYMIPSRICRFKIWIVVLWAFQDHHAAWRHGFLVDSHSQFFLKVHQYHYRH